MENKSKLILHIGRHKSGTSSIQNFLSINRKKLMDIGYTYHQSPDGRPAHHYLAEALARKNHKKMSLQASMGKLKQLKSTFEQCIDKNKINIISSEAFQNCDPKLVRAFFEDFDVLVICYLRDEISYLKSAYLQKVHATNYHESIYSFYDNFTPDYSKFVALWSECFENIIFRAFSRDELYQNDVVSDFLFSLNINREGFFDIGKQHNPSLSRRYLEIKLALNKEYPSSLTTDRVLYKKLGELSMDDSTKYELPVDLLLNFDKSKLSSNDFQDRVFGKQVFHYKDIESIKSEIMELITDV